MKEYYQQPLAEVIRFTTADIITTSIETPDSEFNQPDIPEGEL